MYYRLDFGTNQSIQCCVWGLKEVKHLFFAGNGGALFGPFNFDSVAPQAFERIVFSGFAAEDVDHNCSAVDDDPVGVRVADCTGWRVAGLLKVYFNGLADFPRVGSGHPGAKDEVVGEVCDALDVQNLDVFGFVIVCPAGNFDGGFLCGNDFILRFGFPGIQVSFVLSGGWIVCLYSRGTQVYV